MIEITEEKLAVLREKIEKEQSPKRFVHTLAVERMTAKLCKLYCPKKELPMRAAAILHDMTKEKTKEEQKELLEKLGIPVTENDLKSPKTLHAMSAAGLIPVLYPEFANEITVNAVRWHTTGHEGMTLTEKLLYLADYIDESRTYEHCITLRNLFWNANPEEMSMEEREEHLRKILVKSFDYTLFDLIEEGNPITRESVEARNALLNTKA